MDAYEFAVLVPPGLKIKILVTKFHKNYIKVLMCATERKASSNYVSERSSPRYQNYL